MKGAAAGPGHRGGQARGGGERGGLRIEGAIDKRAKLAIMKAAMSGVGWG